MKRFIAHINNVVYFFSESLKFFVSSLIRNYYKKKKKWNNPIKSNTMSAWTHTYANRRTTLEVLPHIWRLFLTKPVISLWKWWIFSRTAITSSSAGAHTTGGIHRMTTVCQGFLVWVQNREGVCLHGLIYKICIYTYKVVLCLFWKLCSKVTSYRRQLLC